jgi:hypothetical protein
MIPTQSPGLDASLNVFATGEELRLPPEVVLSPIISDELPEGTGPRETSVGEDK